jgi:mycothiol synthase
VTSSAVRFRPAAPADADGVAALVNERERLDRGVTDTTVAAVRAQWSGPDVDLGADARIGELEGRIVCGALATRDREYVYVAPDHERQGLGTRLLQWVMARSVARGALRHLQIIGSANTAAATLLAGAGYERVRGLERMSLALDRWAGAPATDAGQIRVRAIDRERDAHELHRLDTAAFADNPDYQPETFEQFRDEHLRGDGIDASAMLVAVDRDRIVGYLLGMRRRAGTVGYVSLLGVDPEARRRGIARLLLSSAFGIWRGAGIARAELTVASDNPAATRLYEDVGMRVAFKLDCYERPLARR